MEGKYTMILLVACLCGYAIGVHVPEDAVDISADAVAAADAVGEDPDGKDGAGDGDDKKDDDDSSMLFKGEKKDFDVDVVYTWVEEPKKNSKTFKEIEKLCGMKEKGSGNGIQRYRDCGTFEYSLLSVQKYLPWVRKVWLVSERGSLPKWIHSPRLQNVTNKVKGISHTDIWPSDKKDKQLPTHNSNAIETHIHRIPGLAERFIYFNNDFFIGKPLKRSDFYNKRGQAIYLDRRNMTNKLKNINLTKMKGRDGAVSLGNFQMLHQATPFLKSAMAGLQKEKEFTQEFADVSGERCRPDDALRFMPFWFLGWYQIKKGFSEVRPWKKDLAEFSGILKGPMADGKKDGVQEKNWYLKQLEVRPRLFCVEDDFSYDDKVFEEQFKRLHVFLATYFGSLVEETGDSGLPKSWDKLTDWLKKEKKDNKDKKDQAQDPEVIEKAMEVKEDHDGEEDEGKILSNKIHDNKDNKDKNKDKGKKGGKKNNPNFNKHQDEEHNNGKNGKIEQ